ncbi:MAG: hypothetical protein ACYS8W_13225 [Planctomycetota bacterium]|jgi:hypothetical protein
MLNVVKFFAALGRNYRGVFRFLEHLSPAAMKFMKPDSVRCYFITGTGRCGTMLLARLLATAGNSECFHERTPAYEILKEAYSSGDLGELRLRAYKYIKPYVFNANLKGWSYGESSGLLYLLLPELYRIYGNNVRFILLTRHPATYVASAIARGFFVPHHKHPLEHIRAKSSTELGRRWHKATPFEKNLWYWNTVNSIVLGFFKTIPANLWTILRVEDISIKTFRTLFDFLQLHGFAESLILPLLKKRINASPLQRGDLEINPYSNPIEIAEYGTWTREMKLIYEKWISPEINNFYPENPLRLRKNVTNPINNCSSGVGAS